jgi:threonine synthase
LVKDESQNPTGSFKARGMAVAVAAAREARLLAAPSAGNAGSALAAYGARAGIPVRLFLPDRTPAPYVAEARRLGARIDLVPGSIADAGRALRQTLGPSGPGTFRDLSTLREPYRVEGKKTMGYEIAEAMNWTFPDVIVYPAGGGTGLVGIWKAVAEMAELGWIDSKRPRMMMVQAAGCAPVVRAYQQNKDHADPFENAYTVASGLRVPVAIGDYLMLQAVRESGGTAVTVTDEELLASMREMASTEGVFAAPEAAATLAALPKLRDGGAIKATDQVLLLLTGAGMKYFEQVPVKLPTVDPAQPSRSIA